MIIIETSTIELVRARHDSYSVKALGILNADHGPGDEHYGIPDPGMFVIDRQGRTVGKVFVKGYATRVDAAAGTPRIIRRLGHLIG